MGDFAILMALEGSVDPLDDHPLEGASPMMRHRSDLSPTEVQSWSSLGPTDLFYARLPDWRSVCSRR